MTRAQAPFLRVPNADGTLVATPGVTPPDDLVPSMLAASDVLGTGWFAADAANVKPGATVVVVGDGSLGLVRGLSSQHSGRRSRGLARRACSQAHGRRAHHRHESAQKAPAVGPRVWRDGHRDRARRR